MKENTIIAHRLICDFVGEAGPLGVPITKELLNSCSTARTKYRAYLEEEKMKKVFQEKGQKRKQVEDELKTLQKKRKIVSSVCDSLLKDADKLVEEAEKKTGAKMAELITKSNCMRKTLKEKLAEGKALDVQVEKKQRN